MNIPHRIIYDQDGDIVTTIYGGDMTGNVSDRKHISSLSYIDLDIDLSKFMISRVNTDTSEVITEAISHVKTDEQLRIEQLENELLLASGVI